MRALEKRKATRILLQKKKNNQKIMLNIGCGTDYKNGWINIDNNSDNNIKKLDLNWDLKYALPFADNSVDFIYNEHFLEHLTVEDGVNVTKDFIRVLKPKGVLRIAMPDLKNTVEKYFDPNWKNAPVIKKFGLEYIQTKAEMINIGFRAWGHKWLYDAEELQRRLKEAGCINIKMCKLRQSDYDNLMNIETREESTLIAEVIK